MNLPRNDRELTALFEKARVPSASEFDGTYEVHMLTILPSLRIIDHHKVFRQESGRTAGNNVFFRNFTWGRVRLTEGVCQPLGGLPVLLISYDRPDNTIFSRGMRDHVRCLAQGQLYLGRFNFQIGKKLLFLGYFALKKRDT